MIRYPRGSGPGASLSAPPKELPFAVAETLQEGRDVQLWALGDMQPLARSAAQRLAGQGISAGIVNPRFIRPLDRDLLLRQARTARCIAVLENGIASGGFGSLVAESLSEAGCRVPCLRFGWPVEFIPQGPFETLANRYGLSPEAIAKAIETAAGTRVA